MSGNSKWRMGVAATVSAAVIIFGLKLWYGHLAQAGEDHSRIEQSEKVQSELVALTKSLGAIHDAEQAAMAKVGELCRSGKLTDCGDCGAAGVELLKCMSNYKGEIRWKARSGI